MPIEVTHEGQETAPEVADEVTEDDVVEIKKTPRLSLHAQREEILSKLHLDIIVPRWTIQDEEGKRVIIVRYKPVESKLVEKSLTKRSQDERQDEASLLVHADLLVNHCIGVFAVLDDDYDRKYSLALDENGEPNTHPTAEWTKV